MCDIWALLVCCDEFSVMRFYVIRFVKIVSWKSINSFFFFWIWLGIRKGNIGLKAIIKLYCNKIVTKMFSAFPPCYIPMEYAEKYIFMIYEAWNSFYNLNKWRYGEKKKSYVSSSWYSNKYGFTKPIKIRREKITLSRRALIQL